MSTVRALPATLQKLKAGAYRGNCKCGATVQIALRRMHAYADADCAYPLDLQLRPDRAPALVHASPAGTA
jgi:hypothetical protein